MHVPGEEFRVRLTGVDKMNNPFVRLDPGVCSSSFRFIQKLFNFIQVYSPTELEVEIAKITDQVIGVDETRNFVESDHQIYVLNNDMDAARYSLAAFCENSAAVTVTAWYNENGDNDDSDNENSIYCPSSAVRADAPEGYEPNGPCHFNMKISTTSAASTTCYLVRMTHYNLV